MSIPAGSNIYRKYNRQLKYDSGGIEHDHIDLGFIKECAIPPGSKRGELYIYYKYMIPPGSFLYSLISKLIFLS